MIQLHFQRAYDSTSVQALNLSASFYSMLSEMLAEISDGMVITDKKQDIIYVNTAFLQMTGYATNEILAQNCSILLGSKSNKRTVAKINSTLAEGKPFEGKILNYRKDGSAFLNALLIRPLYNDFGEVDYFLRLQRDQSTNQPATESFSFLELLDPNANVGDLGMLKMLLSNCYASTDLDRVSKSLLKKFGSYAAIVASPEDVLRRTPGISDKAIAVIKFITSSLVQITRAEVSKKPILSDFDKLITYLSVSLAKEHVEIFRVLYLNAHNELLSDEEISRGTINHVTVYPREVIRRALQIGATALILVHNHPSGDPTPSEEDIQTTRNMKYAAKIMSITLHDHIIIGRGRWSSLAAFGLMQ